MTDFVKKLIYDYFIDILLFLVVLLFFILQLSGVINQQTLLFVSLFVLGSILLRLLTSKYLDFILLVRNTQFYPDNRTANFLTFDLLKFLLILISLTAIIILGLNKVLSNETIATLLGGLVGSLLTMKGSYSDPRPISKEEQDELEKRIPIK